MLFKFPQQIVHFPQSLAFTQVKDDHLQYDTVNYDIDYSPLKSAHRLSINIDPLKSLFMDGESMRRTILMGPKYMQPINHREVG